MKKHQLKSLIKEEIQKEIKIENPRDIFFVTDKGKEAYNNYRELNRIMVFFGEEDPIDYLTSNESPIRTQYLQILNLSIFEDEKIINLDKPNKISEFIDNTINKLGIFEDEQEAKEELNKLKKLGWIK